MFDRYNNRKRMEDADLNLTPIMNLFVSMIPMLLMSASFFQLAVVNASVPTVAGEDTVFALEKKKVNMTLQIKSNGFKVSGGNEYLTEQEMRRLKTFLPVQKSEYPFSTLTQFLYQIKKKYPPSDTLVIVPDKDIKYQTLIRSMDAARSIKANQETEKDFDLFPNVVVSSVVE